MGPVPSTIVSGVFLLVGLGALYSMLRVLGKGAGAHRKGWVWAHRVSGYLFAGLVDFLVEKQKK